MRHDLTTAVDPGASLSLPGAGIGLRAHAVQFYESDRYLVTSLARFIIDGDTAIVLATRAHREELESELGRRGFDVAHATRTGRLVALDAGETLAKILVDGMPDEHRFAEIVEPLIARAANASATRVRAFGELVALLWAEGKQAAALRLEELWNDLGTRYPFALLCGYPTTAFGGVDDAAPFLRVCGEHSTVIPGETFGALTDEGERLRIVADLQQKARAFDTTFLERQRYHETKARLAAIIESSDDAIVGKTLDGIITSWNRGAERIFGYTADEVVGTPISRLLPPERENEFPTILAALGRGERVEHYETERVRKDGERIHVSLTISPIKDASGRIIGASKVARDVTEQRRAAEALQASRDAEAAANRAKDEFLSVISHELRTPLAATLGWVNVLKAGAGGDQASRAIEAIERSSRAQAKLIEDLLDVSRIIAGEMRVELRLIGLRRVVLDALDTVRPAAEAKGVQIVDSLDPFVGPVFGDADRLRQVTTNLLSNAVKFTPAGGLIEVLVERGEGSVRLVVRDTGEGITPDFLPFVFERFRQADTGRSRRTGGLGLGLAIARHLVELHGGTVRVASDGKDRGSEFIVELPLPSFGVPA